MPETPIKYDEAIAELEKMVTRFERAEIGVDELVSQIKRAGVLIKTCRQRLKTVEDEVKAAIAELDGEVSPEPAVAEAQATVQQKTAKPAGKQAKAAPTADEEDDPFADVLPAPKRAVKPGKDEPGGLFGL
jgi:exodeoxyribonuclease VII small subunit